MPTEMLIGTDDEGGADFEDNFRILTFVTGDRWSGIVFRNLTFVSGDRCSSPDSRSDHTPGEGSGLPRADDAAPVDASCLFEQPHKEAAATRNENRMQIVSAKISNSALFMFIKSV